MKLKKLLSFLLAIILCLGLMSGMTPADAAEFQITEAGCGCYGMYCYAKYICDTDGNDRLSAAECNAVTEFVMLNVCDELLYEHGVNLEAKDFTDMSLLQKFPNLETVWVFSGSSLNLRGLKKLKTVYSQSYSLTSLDVNLCTALEYVNVANNSALTSIDLGSTTALKSLYVYGCSSLSELWMGYHPNLIELCCHGTAVTSLDFSGCRELDATVRFGTRNLDTEILEISLGKRSITANAGVTISLAENVYNPFTDVPRDKYYYEPVMWAYYHAPQITGGVTATSFGPNKECTREQIMTFLWKANGAPEPESDTCAFTDVKSGKYYYKAIIWAVENKITGGVGNGKFGVGKPCTRAQTVTFLWKAMGSPDPGTSSNPFTDVEPGKYYYNAILWAVKEGVTGGVGGGKFGVSKTCTRAQVVTFLSKCYAPKG